MFAKQGDVLRLDLPAGPVRALASTRTFASAFAPAWMMTRSGSYSFRAATISADFAPPGSVLRKTCCHGEATQTTGS